MRIRAALLSVVMLLPAGFLHAQDNRLIPVGDYAYEYIVRLQRRGHLLELNPTSVPYQRGDILRALANVDTLRLEVSEAYWIKLLNRSLKPARKSEDEAEVGYRFAVAANTINSDRMDMMRPHGDAVNFYWYGTWASAYIDTGPVVAEMGLYHNRFYENDPDGLDTALRLWARSEHTYAGVHTRWASLYAGRWDAHWAVPGATAVAVSSNARSRDQLMLRLGGPRLSVTGLLSELDSATGAYFTGRAADDTVRTAGTRRFFAAHRWDWRPSRKFMISFMESAIYSGIGSGISLKYLNPLHPFTFIVDNVPKNDENNGFLGGLMWAQYRKLTLHGQLFVDDIKLQPSKGPETITYIVTGSAAYALPRADLTFGFDAVTSRAYNAPQAPGRYIYLNRGLATQFSDYVQTSLGVEVFLDSWVPGLRTGAGAVVLWQGERDMRQPFPGLDERPRNILDGSVQRTVRGAVLAAWQPRHWFWISMDLGVNTTSQDLMPQETRFVGLVHAGLRLTLEGGLNLWSW
ncbi:MAG: hypothetical protein OXI38_11625 [Bacteroidota bacterium]|nr:hypothetical protein [Bacteroidota bacterium]